MLSEGRVLGCSCLQGDVYHRKRAKDGLSHQHGTKSLGWNWGTSHSTEELRQVCGAGPDTISGCPTKEQFTEMRAKKYCSSYFTWCCAGTSHIWYPKLSNPSLPSQWKATQATPEAPKQQRGVEISAPLEPTLHMHLPEPPSISVQMFTELASLSSLSS